MSEEDWKFMKEQFESLARTIDSLNKAIKATNQRIDILAKQGADNE